ncbi:MAG: rRNA pseudouridine synthase [Candidatus Synoicihabitans palmerolidicus]|nr:rRNA pseudouridine synthase [Candidatus Synoicihabitans palmerolidicus]
MRRLDQLLANLGYCSRRDARSWVAADRVTINGTPARNSSAKADPTQVLIDGGAPDHPDGLLLLKPTGLVCSHEPNEGPSIYDLLSARWRARNPVITSVGLLDKDTSGLILLTDQSKLVHRLTSPKQKVDKVYRATVDQDLDPVLIATFAAGMLQLEGEKAPCAPAQLAIRTPRVAEITLIEGKYHQARRMFASQGWHVESLHRERFGPPDSRRRRPLHVARTRPDRLRPTLGSVFHFTSGSLPFAFLPLGV